MDNLLPEVEYGNIEYKRELLSINKIKFNSLVSQLLWRLEEGNGTAYYYIGVDDNGTIYGLTKKKLSRTFKILKNMAKKVNCDIIELERKILNDKICVKYGFKKREEIKFKDEIRIAFIGPSNSGKSTTISALLYSETDDGNGSLRLNIFNHKHEIYSGLTSSVSTDIIGFYNKKLINYSLYPNMKISNICSTSDKIITMIDLPGHKKYLKTTLSGILTYKPDYLAIVISSLDDYDYDFYKQLNIPYFIIITKIDLQKSNKCGDNIFPISNVTYDGFNKLINYLSNLESVNCIKNNNNFIINDTYYNEDIGLIVSGLLDDNYNIKLNDKLYIGCNNNFYECIIKAIYRKQISVNVLQNNELGTLFIKLLNGDPYKINKNMIITNNHKLLLTNKYTIFINNHNLKKNSTIKIYYKNNSDVFTIIDIHNNILFIKAHHKIYMPKNIKIIIKSNNSNYIGRCLTPTF
jgi:GTPase